MSGLTAASGAILTKVVLTERGFPVPMVNSIQTSRMSRRTVVGLIIFVLYGACYTVRTEDFVTDFAFAGVVTAEDGRPLKDVNVCFVDTGIDQWRQGSGSAIVVAVTDHNGVFSERFRYQWGVEYRLPGPRPSIPGTFELVFGRAGFEAVREEYRLADIPTLNQEKVLQGLDVSLVKSQPLIQTAADQCWNRVPQSGES